MIILGLVNLILLALSWLFFIPKEFRYKKLINLNRIIQNQALYIFIIFSVVTFHIIEVNFIDKAITEWIGTNFASTIQGIEGDTVYWFSQHWIPILLYFFVIIYIAIYPFTLWFGPLYFIICEKDKSLKTLAYGLLLIYLIALPFYLFIPITNVYTYYNVNSALETVIPSIEKFFYSTTTHNNCLPSLHTAMTILIARSIQLTGNKKFTYFGFFVMTCVIISVIYLSIHWITDVITGAAIAVGAIFLLNRYMRDKESDE